MNDKTLQKIDENEFEIDLGRIFRAILDRAWMVAIVTVLCTVLAAVGTFFLITPQYEAAAMFYVNNSSASANNTSQSLSSGDLTTSRSLVDSYIVILNTRETMKDVSDYAGVSRSFSQLKNMISAKAVNGTEIIKVTVTSEDPAEAEKIANAIARIMPQRIGAIIEGTSAKVVDYAVVPTSPSSPNYLKNIVVGFLLGFVLSVAAVVLREIFDITIRSEEDVTQVCIHPILTSVPDMTAPGKGGSYYSRAGKSGRKKAASTYAAGKTRGQQVALLGEDISFTASEAYKLLRTKLQFSFADEDGCRVIGLSSALSGEGKSLSASNLAFTLSQLNKKVILIDCDMRRPTLAEKLGVKKKPGLSSFLTGQCSLEKLIQGYALKNGEIAFHVIAAGENPPNPVELLSSGRMEKMIDALRKVYDYVIIDLPPVGEVTDAMAVAKKTDGMLLVVRQNFCDRLVLSEAVRQFEFIDTRILGVVFNCTSEHTGKYGKGHYKRYYKRYYQGYGRSYESAAKPGKEAK